MNKKTCIFIGGKQIGVNCLGQLIKHNITPQLIIANKDDIGKDTWHESVVKFARKHRLHVIEKTGISNKAIITKIQSLQPDIIFCIGATQIISKEIINSAVLGCINIHPALLPKYRGRYSTVHAIFNGDKKAGVTLHWMDEGIDSGPIIMQKSFSVSRDDTAKTVYDKFTSIGEKLFVSFIKEWLAGKKITSKKQNERKATYFPKDLPNSGQIDWNWNGEKIYNFIRAMTFEPFPPPSFMMGKKKMVVIDEKYFKGFE